MRSEHPIPGDPWPHDMSITVEDRSQPLLEMLWLREAYALDVSGDDIPPLLLATPGPAATIIDDETRARWEVSWPRIWHDVAVHAGREVDPRMFDAIGGLRPGSMEREALLRDMFGPSWGDEFGREALDDPSYRRWDEAGMQAVLASMRGGVGDVPERRDLDALVPAWRAGLTRVVSIPCRGEHTRKLGPHALLTTEGTRADSDRYRRALTSFASL